MKNARNIPIYKNQGSVPKLETCLGNYLQSMTFQLVQTSVVGFESIQTFTDLKFKGTWVPFTEQDLILKPEGERSWTWFTVNALTDINLKVTDYIIYNAVKYKVMKKLDYEVYGIYTYHLIESWVTE